jgi:hypothetical protein
MMQLNFIVLLFALLVVLAAYVGLAIALWLMFFPVVVSRHGGRGQMIPRLYSAPLFSFGDHGFYKTGGGNHEG